MAHSDTNLVPAVAMGDELGIIYLIETAQQFWSELEDVLKLPSNEYQTLTLLDAALKRFLLLCTAYHGTCFSPLQLEHAFGMLLDSELFEFHSERMCEIIVDDTQSNTDPHSQFICYNILFWYGKRKPDLFRSQKRWQPLLPLLMDHAMVDIDPDIEDTYTGTVGTSAGVPSIPVPIEAKLRTVAVKLLYEVCRMHNFSLQDLRVFDDDFIDHLFDLVEHTRNMQDDTFNYSVIKLIVSLNEQFMVASLSTSSTQPADIQSPEKKNRVLRVLMRRLGFSKTFGENMIFMLNRAKRTQEDLCMQLLILKILYLIFTTKGTSEYFYTNDLCVLVDVFLRELVDLDEENESLRHNYLRVLHPLLTKTQLRDYPYKRPQVLYTLESLVGRSNIRDVNPTTKRLVERCLGGDCSETSPDGASPEQHIPTAIKLERSNSRVKTLKSSKSVENLKIRREEPRPPMPSLDRLRRTGSNSSSTSLPAVADSKPVPAPPKRRGTGGSTIVGGAHAEKHHNRTGSQGAEHEFHTHHHLLLAPVDPPPSQQKSKTRSRPPPPPPLQTRVVSPLISAPSPTSTASSTSDQLQSQPRRRPPPAPPKRRKPPAIPAERTNSGATITVIRSSEVAGTPLVSTITPKAASNFQQSTIA
ncbi:Protein dip1 [Leucoagaricus sp. SymC.cos]|nr:Protein dip1 [Leucoagaricus sp. SymC.cos]